MKKILIITDNHNYGGVETVHDNLAIAFKDMGYRPVLISAYTCQCAKPIPQGIEFECVEIKSWQRKTLLPLIFKLGLLLNSHRDADVILSSKDFVNVFVVVLHKFLFLKSKLVCNSHTTVSFNAKKIQSRFIFLAISLCRYVYPFADYVANDSKGAAKDAELFFRLKKVHYLPNPVLKNIDIGEPENPFADDDSINIIACGRMVEVKNFELMVQALAIAVKKEPKLHLTFLGDGELRSDLETLTNELGLRQHITFKGFVDNARDYMYYAAGIWLTSHYEGMPTVLIEALSEGCPLLAVDCPNGPSELIENNKYGLLVSSYEPDDHAKALLSFVEQPKKSKDYYRERVKEFEIHNAAKKYLELAGLA